MWLFSIPYVFGLLSIIGLVFCEEDSLRSALNAVNNRQRDISHNRQHKITYYEREPGGYYQLDGKNELAFLKSGSEYNERKAFERAMLNYLSGNKFDINSEVDENEPFSSAFRERIEKDKDKHHSSIPQELKNYYEDRPDSYKDELIKDAYNNDNNNQNLQSEFYELDNSKRSYPSEYYSNLGFNAVGMQKKSRYFEPDGPSESLYLLNYTPRDEIFHNLQTQNLEEYDPALKYYKWNKQLQNELKNDNLIRSYSMKKRFPITKRSSSDGHVDEDFHHKQNLIRKPTDMPVTDPKIAKELSNVFAAAKSKHSLKNKSLITDKMAMFNTTETKSNKSTALAKTVSDVSKEESLQIKKKSIDWSDYFGYDRKKKSDNNIDNSWLLERYHKAIAMATKRNVEYPLQSYQSDSEPKVDDDSNISTSNSNVLLEEPKLNEMDSKLRNLEDSLLDEAIKYTGSQEGIVDSKEIQDVKNAVITRLAAAFSLEKMRQALNEYKQSVAIQLKELEESGKLDDKFKEEKRVSVPRKQAVEEEKEKVPGEDNTIKCSENEEDCDEQLYQPPAEILEEESYWTRGQCPKIQRVCDEIADVLGHYGRLLTPACNIYQACLLCGDNSWFTPTRHCKLLFLANSNSLCDEDVKCLKIANRSVPYLLNIHRSLKAESSDDCDILCPDNRR